MAQDIKSKIIMKGDIITIYFSTAPALHNVKLLRTTPDHLGAGLLWVVCDEFGKIYYVKNFDRMDLILKNDDSPQEA